MLNKEKYKEELEKVIARGLAVSKSGQICTCRDLKTCDKCIFLDGSCVDLAKSWLNSECNDNAILTYEEKAYLSAVIKPFRNKVCDIRKVKELYTLGHESILISVNNYDDFKDDIYLPRFEKGTMYQGMEEGKRYTLEELGL